MRVWPLAFVVLLAGCSDAHTADADAPRWRGPCKHLEGTVDLPAIVVQAKPYPVGWEDADVRLARVNGNGPDRTPFSREVALDDQRCAAFHVERTSTADVLVLLRNHDTGHCPFYLAGMVEGIERNYVEEDLYELEAAYWNRECYAA